ncbi:MAG: orotate phosphoribosyltransferase [Candidatus Omnitrophica bacterium]|nr:orotate phosphoribosyltransferase [Candidatus Omnitrophota bacterium]
MEQSEILKIFESSRALLTGHFLLSSGLHSDRYLQTALVLQEPATALLLGGELAKRFRDAPVSVVIGPALGGVVIAFAVANGLKGSRTIFAERKEGAFTLRRGFEIRKGEKVLVVEDVITTGGSIREVMALVESLEAEVCAVAAVAERSSQPIDFGVRKEVLLRLPLTTFSPDDCLLCRQQIPLVKPGSKTFSQGR